MYYTSDTERWLIPQVFQRHFDNALNYMSVSPEATRQLD